MTKHIHRKLDHLEKRMANIESLLLEMKDQHDRKFSSRMKKGLKQPLEKRGIRKRKRVMAEGNTVVAPADGKICHIIPVESSTPVMRIKKGESGVLGQVYALISDTIKKGTIIGIFMYPYDRHEQWAPLSGKVVLVKHVKGKFYKADENKAFLNERCEIIIENKAIGRVKVIQIAGLVARRIRTYVKEGDMVQKGQMIGKILLGSQTALVLPENVKVEVSKRQRVIGLETVIGRY